MARRFRSCHHAMRSLCIAITLRTLTQLPQLRYSLNTQKLATSYRETIERLFSKHICILQWIGFSLAHLFYATFLPASICVCMHTGDNMEGVLIESVFCCGVFAKTIICLDTYLSRSSLLHTIPSIPFSVHVWLLWKPTLDNVSIVENFSTLYYRHDLYLRAISSTAIRSFLLRSFLIIKSVAIQQASLTKDTYEQRVEGQARTATVS